MARGAHVSILRARAGGHSAAMQGARSAVWYHHMSDEQRRSAAEWPRPDGLRPKSRHTALRGLALVGLGPAPRALSGEILGGNAAHGGC
jgi:hypothetical protein